MEALSFDKHSTINLGFHDGHHIGDGWTQGKNTNASCINIVLDTSYNLNFWDMMLVWGDKARQFITC